MKHWNSLIKDNSLIKIRKFDFDNRILYNMNTTEIQHQTQLKYNSLNKVFNKGY